MVALFEKVIWLFALYSVPFNVIIISVEFLQDFLKSIQLSTFIPTALVGSESTIADSSLVSSVFVSSFISSIVVSSISSWTASTATSSTESLTISVEMSSAALAAPMIQHRRTKHIAIYLIFIVFSS